MTDPISDMLTRIRNALMVKKHEVILPYSGLKFEIAKNLEREGWIERAEKIEDKFAKIKIVLKYDENNEPAISHIDRVSKPGRRVYLSKGKLPVVLNNYGIAIISTSKGIMSNREAKKKGIGGEIICEVY